MEDKPIDKKGEQHRSIKHQHLSDLVNYYRRIVPIEEIDNIIEEVERQHPKLYRSNHREYMTMIEIEVNNYIGMIEQQKRTYSPPEIKEVIPHKKYDQSVEG